MREKDGYSDLKVQLFEVLDAAKDVQLHASSAQYRQQNHVKKINRYIGKKENWYYQHKYAVKAVDSCDEDRQVLQEDLTKLSASFKKFAGVMLPALGDNVKATFVADHQAFQDAIEGLKNMYVDPPVRPTVDNGKLEACAEVDPKIARKAATGDVDAAMELKKLQDDYNHCMSRNGAVTGAYNRAYRTWNNNEIKRKSDLELNEKRDKALLVQSSAFDNVYDEIKNTEKPRGMTMFKAELGDSMKSYDEGVAAVLANKKEMSKDELDGCLERNTQSMNDAMKGYNAAE